jgi:SWI/SNF-related matrix-associated actin-dependent regulator of chromatin subfamily A member 5
MAPRSRQSGNDTDASMADAPEPATTTQPGDDMVLLLSSLFSLVELALLRRFGGEATKLTITSQDVDETPDYTDSDTNPNTTASSVIGEPVTDGRKRRSEANQLRRSIFGRKHDRLGESKVSPASLSIDTRQTLTFLNRKMIPSAAFGTC